MTVDESALIRRIEDIERTARELGPSIAESFAPVIANLQATVIATVEATYSTTVEMEAAIASPGDISPHDVGATGNVSAAGQVISAGVINSPGTKANTVTVGYSSLWADSAGNFGANTSSRRYKQDITPVTTDVPGFLGLTTYKFRYIAAVEEFGDAAPWEYGLIAEEVVEVAPWACFFEDDGVTVKGINYDRLVVTLLNVAQDHEARLKALETKA